MVVVAGGDGHEIPMCVVTEEKDWSNLVFLDKDSRAQMECRTIEFERRRNAMTNRLDMKEIVVIVGDECTLDAQVNDDFVDLSMIFRFSPSSTVKQLKYAIATRFQDIPVLDSFCIHIKSDLSEDSIELVGDNKTIKEFDLVHTNEMKIFIKRIRKEDRTEHRRVCKNDTFLEMLVVNHISLKTPNWLKILFVNEANTVHQLFDNLQEEISVNGYKKEDMCLRSSGITMTKDDYDKTLGEMGFDFSECASVTLLIRKDNTEDVTEASGQGYYIMPNSDWIRPTDKKITLTEILKVPGGKFGRRESPETESKPETVYVGLINQAMTCYLNSLLQALFMTPEFRNALYNWEYVDGSEKDAANSIPYQLQKLFLNLQTSKKNAVETTSLTKSFGWDSTEAWQQHDIQELCRVMFDALEQKFKNTKQADLINRLYEGKMIDYVKCLECGTEKSREDTFLDIPLPVKPFGSAVAYNSVEEALRAFVQPETLDGVNQYFCETCNKKCDAHKGLKFKKFPYILTLHLKRFDFDYNTFHRIKLNDKVTFPDVLNVNSLIPSSTDNLESPSTEEDAGTGVKCDDSSTTDSGNLDESLPCDNGIITSQNNLTNNDQDDDEGIYISNCPSTSSIHSQENDRNRNNRDDCGFHKYDLFSIMIHSGSASGGHYYAYIKDFKTQEWLCFNDQNVSPITLDDIRKTYGGGPSRAFYSGAYSTSTNAYMLMYRQIDYERNCLPMTVDDFPKHIQLLLKQMKEQEEKKHHDRTRQMYKISIYCHHPVERMLCTARIFSVHEELLSETVEKVWSAFSLDHVVSLDQCRLVNYDPTYDIIECSYEGREDETIGSIIQSSRTYESNRPRVPDMLLEIRRKDKKFENYKPVEITTTVFVADVIARKIVDGPFTVRVPLTISVADYKKILGKLTRIHLQQMCLAGGGLTKDGKKIEMSDSKLCEEGFYSGCKIFIETRLDVDKTKPFRDITPKSMWDLYDNIVMMHVYMPNISEEIMKEFNIPAWESEKKEKETDKSIGIAKLWNSDAKIERNDLESIPQKNKDDEAVGENEEWQEQSNSEDSSLSDSDRTLVGDASEDDDFAGLSNVDHELYPQTANDCKDINENLAEDFLGIGEKYGDPVERLKIYVHRQMKRNTLKKKLEPILKVPIKYFKIIRQIVENNEITGVDIRTPTGAFSNNETLTIKLCRAIRDGDFTMRLYLLRLKRNSAMDHEYLCEFMVFKNSTVEHIKREMIVTLKENHNIDIPYERLRLRKKQSETPGAILLDDMTIEIFMKIDEDLDDLNSGEFFVQELPDKEIVTNSNQIVLFAWRYYPAFKKWDEELHEIVRETRSIAEIKTKLSEISGIPVDKVTFTRGRFPINSSYECQWRQECLEHWEQFSEDDWTTWCGLVDTIFYKDSSEGDSTILTEEDCSSRSINHRRVRRTRFDDPSWSPRRERALKIFVDDK